MWTAWLAAWAAVFACLARVLWANHRAGNRMSPRFFAREYAAHCGQAFDFHESRTRRTGRG